MIDGPRLQLLAALGVQVAILSAGRYSLPVRFRIREPAVDCRVPTWCGIGDLIGEEDEVTLVAVVAASPDLQWIFMRGPAAAVAEPDWDGLQPPPCCQVARDDLYQVVRVRPRRIEFIDEGRGWGFRETSDL